MYILNEMKSTKEKYEEEKEQKKRGKIIQYKNETLSNKSHDSITMVKNVKNGYLLWLKMCVKMAYEVRILREDVK